MQDESWFEKVVGYLMMGSIGLLGALLWLAVAGAIVIFVAVALDLTGDDDESGVQRESRCHPSYPDDCLERDAVDYDCAGGEADGPRYVSGPVTVRGSDPFDLDRDGNGVGCES